LYILPPPALVVVDSWFFTVMTFVPGAVDLPFLSATRFLFGLSRSLWVTALPCLAFCSCVPARAAFCYAGFCLPERTLWFWNLDVAGLIALCIPWWRRSDRSSRSVCEYRF